MYGAVTEKIEYRNAWVRGTLEAVEGCDVVFVDPDNGLESGTKRHEIRGPKFVYLDELEPYLDRGQSLVVYHHLGRNTSVENQIRERLVQVNERLGGAFALRYRRGPAKAFLVVPSDAHRELLTERARHLAQDAC